MESVRGEQPPPGCHPAVLQLLRSHSSYRSTDELNDYNSEDEMDEVDGYASEDGKDEDRDGTSGADEKDANR